ncbi:MULTISPECIES: DNA polymerase IV [unclassified Acinetobacter]|uniref:DNA polymerase IV n=1 Tax=unclassified Acinetobacter TaxID=196816 RepID=UPI0035BB8991
MRKIIHIDMDAFYASVELLTRPELANQPMIVAYDRPRSVVTTANYIARQYGLRSAMSVANAKKRCPQVVIVEPNFAKYRQISQQIHAIFARYTDLIEPLSLDEAYLDVTDNLQDLPSATAVAEQIRADIFRETGLTASAGVAPNKFLAKIASDWQKPNGLFVIKPSQVADFIPQLKVEKFFGVGKVTLQKMHALNLFSIADVQKLSEIELIKHFGEKFGHRLFLYAQGIDDRAVQSQRELQQVSKEITLLQDMYLSEIAWAEWQDLSQQVWHSLQKKQLDAYGVQVKLKTKDFKTLQHSKRFQQPINDLASLNLAVQQLLQHFQHTVQQAKQAELCLRLIGVGTFALSGKKQQLQLILL